MQPLNRTIADDFQERHIDLVWQELNERFGFPIKPWKQFFREQMYKQPRNVSDVDYFMTFATTFINPILNDLLRRGRLYPTMNRLVEYVVKKY